MKSLTKTQLLTLEKAVSASLTENFYLAGGTALAIKYSHRPSEDFDFFTFPGKKMDAKSLEKKSLQIPSEILLLEKDTLILNIIYRSRKIKFSFFEYDYPLLERPEFFRDLKIFIASDIDIATMKAVAIAQRGSKKDFYDLWYLMKIHSWTLRELLKAVTKKYKNYNPGIFLKAIVYFKDARRESYPHIDKKWNQIENFFVNEVKKTLV